MMGKESRIKTSLSVERGHREQGDLLGLTPSADFLTQGVPNVFFFLEKFSPPGNEGTQLPFLLWP